MNKDKPVLGKYTFKLLDTGGKSLNLGQREDSVGLSKGLVKVQKTSKKVKVTNVETKEVAIYPSIGAAAARPL